MADQTVLFKNPVISPASDYAFLRLKGMEYIEALGKDFWTDYNIHDPGITLLEALSYAITDLGYRTDFDIKELLAVPPGETRNWNEQAFFTARNILTNHPWTEEDYRRLLIDIDGIKNGWLMVKECACDDLYIYANCAKSILQYPITDHKIIIKGLYDVLIEFEEDASGGDLNSGKMSYNFSYPITEGYATAAIEMRLPSWREIEAGGNQYAAFRGGASAIDKVTVSFISGNKEDNQNIPQTELSRRLRRPLYATLIISYYPDKENDPLTKATLKLKDVPFTVWFHKDADRRLLQLADLAAAIQDSSSAGIIARYLDRVHEADAIMKTTRATLQANRNLCEDWCTISAVAVEDIAVCADMDVTPDADIEAVLAEAYNLISQYMAPDVRFYSLQQLLAAGKPVDQIFEGPPLNNGFIDNDQLAATGLKKVLHTSDIINLLMDIPGVTAIRNLMLARYDRDGKLVENEAWTMDITYQHQPRLYVEGSKFLVFKNGLPFLPDALELSDTLQMIRGREAQPKWPLSENDLPVPEGNYTDLTLYTPVQYTLPRTYGVGTSGLPSHVTAARKAQAQQLKAYLLFFEQMLVQYLAQLSHFKEVFALRDDVSQTYFSRLLGEDDISGITDLYATVDGAILDETSLQKLTEDEETFLNRRNRALDHLLARFGEQFSDYVLMLYSFDQSKPIADKQLIKAKIDFLKDFPLMSSRRGQAFNYADETAVCSSANVSGLETRIRRLLGIKDMDAHFVLYDEKDTDNISGEWRWRLIDEKGKIHLSSTTRYAGADTSGRKKAWAEIREVLKVITDKTHYQVKHGKKWTINLKDSTGEIIAMRKQIFPEEGKAAAALEDLLIFAKDKLFGGQMFIVEHLLLRPRLRPNKDFPEGDPLLPVCLSSDCNLCGDEDPYSFRFTIVMNGETGLANAGIEYRRFAEQVIRMEAPAHLALKICWVSITQLAEFEAVYCAWSAELSREKRDVAGLHNKLVALLAVFTQLKSIYPPATLHDCEDGNDENRVFLNQTII
jgi:hypothetical protein